jgi:hypothetical protein
VRSAWPLAWILVIACSDGAHSTKLPLHSAALGDTNNALQGNREAIPAEWTVAEDTSAAGEITTASLQLPLAREIEGIPGTEPPRLILRCLDGRVAAFIAPESTGTDVDDDTTGRAADLVPVQLDSAPSCE